jgi:uncharacterized damage-inducible protein DinB
MITSQYCSTMAAYNRWVNERLYAVCAKMSDEDRKADRGAFFKSVHSTLNHILYIDLSFLCRFTGDPPEVGEFGVDIYDDFDQLGRERVKIDQRITEWSATLTPEWLATELSFVSRFDGLNRTLARWIMVTQMFNHQTHHRGQVTTLLSQMGLDIGSTDLPFMPGLS